VKTLLYPILRHRPGILGNITLRELISEHVSNSADKKSLSKTALWLQLLQLC